MDGAGHAGSTLESRLLPPNVAVDGAVEGATRGEGAGGGPLDAMAPQPNRTPTPVCNTADNLSKANRGR